MRSEKHSKKPKKSIVLLTVAAALVAVLAVGYSVAYFTDTDEVTNVLTVGDLEVELTETWNPDDGLNLVPGDTIVKKPLIKELKGDAYMRVKLEIRDNTTGDLITDSTRLNKIMSTVYYDPGTNLTAGTAYTTAQLAALTALKQPVNSDAFDALGASGGVYTYGYKSTVNSDVFKVNDQVVLFTNIVIPSDWTQTDIETLGAFKIVVKVQAIQSSGLASRTAAFTALDAELP